jgi:YHS domain-containing protein
MAQRVKDMDTTSATTTDPVCGMTVPADGPLRAEHDGQTFVFCSTGCRGRFSADPNRYSGPPAEEGAVEPVPPILSTAGAMVRTTPAATTPVARTLAR